MKLLTIIVPACNCEGYLARCIDSLLSTGSDEIEVLLVNDGSTDGTAFLADTCQREHPNIVTVIHQDNRGYGGAVNTGLEHASGLYVKVVDSDDWVDRSALRMLVSILLGFSDSEQPVDLVVTNFLFEKSGRRFRKAMRYRNVLPQCRVFTWDEVRPFRIGQYFMSHSLCYRTSVLRDCGFQLPCHTFYVDNLMVFLPLNKVHKLYYLDTDLYHYFIGREDQSVHESVMIRRLDQQIKVNMMMIDHWGASRAEHTNLREYQYHHLEIVTVISSFLAIRSGTTENMTRKEKLWAYIRRTDKVLHARIRYSLPGVLLNLPCFLKRDVPQVVYFFLQKFFGFN